MPEQRYTKSVVRIGIVAYAPKVVTIWEGIKEYLRGQGFNADWILYSNYPALVEALVDGQVDIAWNTPLAYLQAREKLGGQCQVWAMRDTDEGAWRRVARARAQVPRSAARRVPVSGWLAEAPGAGGRPRGGWGGGVGRER